MCRHLHQRRLIELKSQDYIVLGIRYLPCPKKLRVHVLIKIY